MFIGSNMESQTPPSQMTEAFLGRSKGSVPVAGIDANGAAGPVGETKIEMVAQNVLPGDIVRFSIP
jgi:hypothetical protein